MWKQVCGRSERIDRNPPNTLRQGQTTRLPGTCKNSLEIAGKRCVCGVVGAFRTHCRGSGESEIVVEVEVFLESRAVEGKSPVDVRRQLSCTCIYCDGVTKE
jgi:hypothetical protein